MPTRQDFQRLLEQMRQWEHRQILLLHEILKDLEDPPLRETFRELLGEELSHRESLSGVAGT